MKKILTALFKKDLSKSRADFPVLERKINGKPIIYFDNACMALRPRHVLEEMNRYYLEFPGCAGRSNHTIAGEVDHAVEKARASVGSFFHVKPNQVVFTKNTTEAINLVANSLSWNTPKGRNGVLTSDKEHNSNLIPWLKLQKKGILRHTYVHSTPENEFDLTTFEKKIKELKDTIRLVSVVHTSNLDGVTNPIKEIGALAHDVGAELLVDGAQAASHYDIDLKKQNIDFLSCSAHKMLGPSGVGALIARPEALEQLDQFMVGGETVQESSFEGYVPEKIPERFEAGLQNYAGIMGFGAAAAYIENIGKENIHTHITQLNEQITEGLHAIKTVKILGPKDAKKRSGVISFVLEKKKVHEVSLLLNNMHSIMVRSGAHCVHAWFNKPENKTGIFKDGTIRASLGLYNTKEEAELFVQAVQEMSKL